MKLVVFLFLFAVFGCIELVPCSTWRERMQKYSGKRHSIHRNFAIIYRYIFNKKKPFTALLDCEYSISSDHIFVDYFPLEEMERSLELETVTQQQNYTQKIHFYIIGRDQIKFRLSQRQTLDSNEMLRFGKVSNLKI